MEKAPPKHTRMIDEYHMNEILRDNQEESQDERPEISANGSKSLLLEST